MSATGVTLDEGLSLDAAFPTDGQWRWMAVWYDAATGTYLSGYVTDLDAKQAFVVERHHFLDEALQHTMRAVGLNVSVSYDPTRPVPKHK